MTMAAAAAAAAMLGLGDEEEDVGSVEDSLDADDPPRDEEAIEELCFEFRSFFSNASSTTWNARLR
jgi:hypothetical protein